MKIVTIIAALSLALVSSAFAQRTEPASAAELAAITERGRLLAEYDQAAWHSTDAVVALKPKAGVVTGYIARKDGDKWTVVYGRLSEDKKTYVIAYEATQMLSPKEFKVVEFEVPKKNTDAFLFAARALELTRSVFVPPADRPYNAAVIPMAEGKFYVYFVPAQTTTTIFPLGGDTRFTVSSDGTKILERRQLHKSVIEFSVPAGSRPESGYHTAILDDVPEDTDVFHVLSREPKIPELVVTQKFVYQIAADGSIKYLMTTDAFRKIGQPEK